MPLIQDYNKLIEHTDDIKKVILNGNVVWPAARPPVNPYAEPFYSENTTDETKSVTFYRDSDSAPTFDIYYSLDKGNTWNFCGSTAETFTYRNTPHTKVWFCAEASTWEGIAIRDCKKVGGNIMSLLYGPNGFNAQESFETTTTTNVFYNLFSYNSTLTDASELMLPKNTITGCYKQMFIYDTNLTSAPILPAATLVRECYVYLFTRCTSLNEVTCYATSGINTNNSTSNWLSNVSSSGTFYKAAGSTWPSGANGIPSGWTVVEV